MDAVAVDDETQEFRKIVGVWNRMLKKAGVYGGLPLVFPGDNFILTKRDSPQMRFAKEFVSHMGKEADEQAIVETPMKERETPRETEPVVRNSWCTIEGRGVNARQFFVSIVEINPEAPEQERRVRLEKQEIIPPLMGRLNFALKTITRGGQAIPTAEQKAHTKLKELLDPARYDRFLLTGAVVERGKSGVFYIIRKHRPTIAMRYEENESDGRVLCSLCLHPLGYFGGSWAGALPPTDEVVAHLLFIRSDEHFFWKKANQIPAEEINSGI